MKIELEFLELQYVVDALMDKGGVTLGLEQELMTRPYSEQMLRKQLEVYVSNWFTIYNSKSLNYTPEARDVFRACGRAVSEILARTFQMKADATSTIDTAAPPT